MREDLKCKGLKLYDQGMRYLYNIQNGTEVVNSSMKKTANKLIKEYEEKQLDEDWEYYFDIKAVGKINNILKLLNFATGFVAGKPVLDSLGDYQAFLILNLFAWRFKSKPYKFKHNDICLYLARKNAKTATAGIIYILLMLTEQNYSEFYSICLNRELAGEIRKSMVQILNASPAVEKYFDISISFLGKLECKLTHSFFQPRVAQAGKNNSIRPSAFVADEMGNMEDRDNFDAMRSGQKNVLNPLVFRTTTAYPTDNSIMIAEIDYFNKVLDGVVEDDNVLALLYYAEEEHLWDDIGLYQANPLRIEENYDTIRKNRQKALIQEELVSEYLTKEMNVFQPSNDSEPYIRIEDLRKCKMTEEEMEEFSWVGRDIFSGLDMALTDDNVSYGFVAYDEEKDMFYIDAKAFIPADSIDSKSRKEHVNYRQFIRNGNCVACGDRVVSYKTIEDTYLEDLDNMGVRNLGLGYDKMNCIHTKNYLEQYGVPVEEVRQFSTRLHCGTKLLKEYILMGKVRYFPNQLLEINFSNAQKMEDNMRNMYINKKKSTGKVDMVAGIINAMCLWYDKLNEQSAYEEEGVRFI